MSSVKETIQAGSFKEFHEPGDFFRLLATTGPVNVEFYYMGRETVDVEGVEAGYAEYFRGEGQSPFDRVRIYSASTQSVQFVTRNGSDVRYDRGASTVGGSVDLNAGTIAQLRSPRPEANTGRYASSAAIAANTAHVVFLPGANTNGAILLTADINAYDNTTSCLGAFVAKSITPTSINDGDVLLTSKVTAIAGASAASSGTLPEMQFIPAGLGLYYITSNNLLTYALQHRACRYKLL